MHQSVRPSNSLVCQSDSPSQGCLRTKRERKAAVFVCRRVQMILAFFSWHKPRNILDYPTKCRCEFKMKWNGRQHGYVSNQIKYPAEGTFCGDVARDGANACYEAWHNVSTSRTRSTDVFNTTARVVQFGFSNSFRRLYGSNDVSRYAKNRMQKNKNYRKWWQDNIKLCH